MDTFFAHKDGKITTIDEVEKGLKCGCTCIECGEKLVAKKGTKNVHHFAHYFESSCSGGGESQLHLMAKEYFESTNTIMLPKHIVKQHGWSYYFSGKTCKYDNVILEESQVNFRPDIKLMFGDKPLFIEVAVTSFVGEEKLQKIKDRGISCVEIDFRGIYKYKYSSLKSLRNAIERHIKDLSNWKWIYNPKRVQLKDLPKYDLVVGKDYLKNRRCKINNSCSNCDYAINFNETKFESENYNEKYSVTCGLPANIKSIKRLYHLNYTKKFLALEDYVKKQIKYWRSAQDSYKFYKNQGYSTSKKILHDLEQYDVAYFNEKKKIQLINTKYKNEKFSGFESSDKIPFCWRISNGSRDHFTNININDKDFEMFYKKRSAPSHQWLYLLIEIDYELYEYKAMYNGNNWITDKKEEINSYINNIYGWSEKPYQNKQND